MVTATVLLLDADILIDIQRGHGPAATWMASLAQLPAVAGIAALELAFGCRTSHDVRTVHRFLRPFELLWPTEDDFRFALSEAPKLHLSHGTGVFDALVAATALRTGRAVATFNARHYAAFRGVNVHQPYER